MSRVDSQMWDELLPKLRVAAREGLIDPTYIENPDYRPTHIIDIYKMRRGRYRGIRIWSHIHLGTGYRIDLFMTNANNAPIEFKMDAFQTMDEDMIGNWRDILKEG